MDATTITAVAVLVGTTVALLREVRMWHGTIAVLAAVIRNHYRFLAALEKWRDRQHES